MSSEKFHYARVYGKPDLLAYAIHIRCPRCGFYRTNVYTVPLKAADPDDAIIHDAEIFRLDDKDAVILDRKGCKIVTSNDPEFTHYPFVELIEPKHHKGC